TFAVGGGQLIQIPRPNRSPREAVPGSERCEIDIVGNEMGAALEASVKEPPIPCLRCRRGAVNRP
ncbi:hypothetical protein MTO96_050325, partial [Rhipicephalus appendiculatus]